MFFIGPRSLCKHRLPSPTNGQTTFFLYGFARFQISWLLMQKVNNSPHGEYFRFDAGQQDESIELN